MPGMTTNRSVRGDVRTVWIGNVWPELDGGRFPVKRKVGDLFEVTADILREGHEALAAVLKYRTVKDTAWREVRMEPLGNDRWVARFPLEENIRYLYTIEAFPDQYRLAVRQAGMEVALDYALQCSPDHPYVREHPEWFHTQPDGTIKYAETPPRSTRTSTR